MTNLKLKLKQQTQAVVKFLFGVKTKEKITYFHHTKQWPNLNEPKTWGEKLLWLNHHWQPEVKSICADKYGVREYIEQKGLENILIQLLGVWDDASDIDFDTLPDKFVLKCNHGCAMNILVTDKAKLDKQEAVNQLNEWLKVDLGKASGEYHYSKIRPRVIAEAFLPVEKETDVVDFKIHCFNGQPKFIGVCYDRDPITHASKGLIYSPQWERMLILQGDDPACSYPKPERLEDMLEMAKKLSADFPYVRVDLYAIQDQVFFGELTFSPDGNIPEREYTKEACALIGNWLDLSEIKL